MGKRLVICCDGTWNQPDQKEGLALCPTNVVKLAALVRPKGDDGVEQRIFYHDGIGSEASGLRRKFEGATGSGINRVIKACYRWLVRTYQPGDELYFFGFSRGAYTARSLAGMVRNSGILRPEQEDQLEAAFRLYRSRDGRKTPRAAASRLFRQSYGWEDETSIACIGVWDTVGSLGVPDTLTRGLLKRIGFNHDFHDTDLSSLVRCAFHALAIDEQRKPFQPTLWTQTAEGQASGQKFEQRWFAGCHGDVGGGVSGTALTDITLRWMVDAARAAGLDLLDVENDGPPDFPPFRPDPLGPIHPSMTRFYSLFGSGVRTIAADNQAGVTDEEIYPSAKQRWHADTGWRPVALVDYDKRNPGIL